jgi:monovalent cation:H+ antiporter, CPA1 family
MNQFLQTESFVIGLLLVVAIVAILVRRLRVPYTMALVLVGLFISTLIKINIELTPELILALFVPPLIFEAAFHIHFQELKRNYVWIFLLAVPGVVLTTALVGGMLSLTTNMGLGLALLFGAIVSATDPIAVVAVFRKFGAPKALQVIMEGESLLNDGTAIVLFNILLLTLLPGGASWSEGVIAFLRVTAGGLFVGLVLGWVIARFIATIDDYLIETTLTTILAYGAYLIADRLQVSGVLAVVAAGIICGNLGQRGMSPTTRIVLVNFWEYVAFLANSFVFLLIGLKVDIGAIITFWQPLAVAILAVLLARILLVFGLGWIANRFSEQKISLRWKTALSWGGLRGAISLALALSLPAVLDPGREQLRVMAFGVVLFTLLIQSTTMRFLMKQLNILPRKDAHLEFQIRHARLLSAQAADEYLDQLKNRGLLLAPAWEKLKTRQAKQTLFLTEKAQEILIADPDLEESQMEAASRELLRVQRATLQSLRQGGVISQDAFDRVVGELDHALTLGTDNVPFVDPVDRSALFFDVLLGPGAFAVGKTVSAISMPEHAIIVSIHRNHQILIPRGNTLLLANDSLSVLCRSEILHEARSLLLGADTDTKKSFGPSAKLPSKKRASKRQ